MSKNWELNKNYNIDKLLYFLIDRPDYISKCKNFIWLNEKEERHRNYDLPALYYYNVEVQWILDNHIKRYYCNVDIE